MSKCLSKRCQQEVQAGWSFCPNCGKDNRPNEFRPTILNCAHRFAGPKRYCVICGEGFGGAKAASATAANIRFGWTLSVIGVVLIAASVAVKHIMDTGSGPGYQWIHSWYSSAFALSGDFVLHGTDMPLYSMVAGSALLFFGVIGTIAAKLNKPRPKRPASNSKPVPKA